MMYKFSDKLKSFSMFLMIIGIIGVGYSFLSTPSSIEQVKKMLHNSHKSDNLVNGESKLELKKEAQETLADKYGDPQIHNSHTLAENAYQTQMDSHIQHVYHQLKNKPWSALYVAVLFSMLIALGTLVFYALQYVSQAGWSIVILRVMEGISAYLPVGSSILIVLLICSSLHWNHIFTWMNSEALDPNSPMYDALLSEKKGFLNIPFFLIRSFIYILGWNLYRYFSRRRSIDQDNAKDYNPYNKNFKRSAAFLVFFLISESMMSWDWIMSIDHHWFSTLFGWYVFASLIVCAVTVIAMVTIYLKSKGYLDIINDSHIHDLAKFMFGFSVFWAYLWFSQFLLIWYADIPEEVTYYVTRFQEYKIPFFSMVVMNFIFPVLLLINSDYKRIPWFVVIAGVVILLGHYIDFYIMVMPGTVGESWSFGIPEISSLLFIIGLFIYVVFTSLTKAPLIVKRNPFLKESEGFQY